MNKPVSTYRLQLRKELGFRAATDLVDWLDDLGVTHAYVSPYLSAQPGSTHGYDLVDPTRLDPQLGTEDDYAAWTRALAERGMGHIVDVVPNHMAATTGNKWWHDVLENGPSSPYADYFDVEWHPPKAALVDKVLLPILGAQYGEVLEKGELRLERHDGAFCVRYWERCLPVNPPSVVPVLERAASGLAMPPSDPRRQELESIVTGLRHLPASHETDPERRAERQREKEVLKRRLAQACADPEIAAAVDREVERINGAPGDPRSFDDLDRLLLDQNFRLAFWRVATEEINYRRFFDVNELAAVRMECDAVFDDAHALLLANVRAGRVQGLRLDHIDGLYDPAAYLAKVRAAAGDVYLVVEKILSHAEELPKSWPVEGTTGYDFLASASGLFVDKRAEAAFTRAYQAFTGDGATYAEHVLQSKRMILRSSLSSELHMLALRLERIAMRDRRSRDFTLAMLRRAIAESIASFPVYRTYVHPDGSHEPIDQAIVTRAVRLARRRNPDMSPSVFDFLRDVLLLEHADAERAEFTMRFQQLTGPVTAKGVEDTAFYTYLRFASLNEVGGSPDRFGTTIADFHAHNAARREHWPHAMTAVATHDTKRGADVRARLAVLSEMPEQWEAWAREWVAMSEMHVRAIDEETAPSLGDRWLFFQTALGAHPLEGGSDAYVERLAAYMLKAAREAKKHTSWLSPDETYEDALRSFVVSTMNDERFARSLAERAAQIATHGASNGLALVTLEAASPGVADTYQGGELWDLSLVDPDNREPVDYARRRELLRRCDGVRPRELLAAYADGRVKLHVLRAALRLRRARPELFLDGDYAPIDAGDEIVAFSRTHASGSLVCAVTRLPYAVTRGAAPWAVGDVWGDRVVAVPRGRFRDAFTGREHESTGALRASRIFEELPVAILVST